MHSTPCARRRGWAARGQRARSPPPGRPRRSTSQAAGADRRRGPAGGRRSGRAGGDARQHAGACCSTGCVAPPSTARHRRCATAACRRSPRPAPRRCRAAGRWGWWWRCAGGGADARGGRGGARRRRPRRRRRRWPIACCGDRGASCGLGTQRQRRSRRGSRRCTLDDYVAEVVAGESPPDAADAAQAGAGHCRADLRPGQPRTARRGGLRSVRHDALPGGARRRPRVPAPRRRRTSGRVLLARGRLATGLPFGLVRRPSRAAIRSVAGHADDAGAAAHDDECIGEPEWTSELRAADLERAFRAAGLRGDRLRGLRVAARNRTGRVTRIDVEGWSPSLSGQEFRTIVGRQLGWQHVKSTLFDLERTRGGLSRPRPRLRPRRGPLRPRRGPPGGARRHCRFDPGRLLSRAVDWPRPRGAGRRRRRRAAGAAGRGEERARDARRAAAPLARRHRRAPLACPRRRFCA